MFSFASALLSSFAFRDNAVFYQLASKLSFVMFRRTNETTTHIWHLNIFYYLYDYFHCILSIDALLVEEDRSILEWHNFFQFGGEEYVRMALLLQV